MDASIVIMGLSLTITEMVFKSSLKLHITIFSYNLESAQKAY